MSIGLMPYSSTKPSDVGWLGDVPSHWALRRLRATVEGCVNGVWGNEPNGRDDLICVRVADFDRGRFRIQLERKTMRAVIPSERARRLLRKGDLLLEKSGGGDLQPVGVVMLYEHDDPAVCSNFVARMPVASPHHPRYLAYLHSHLYALKLNVRSIKQTTGIQNLDSYSYLVLVRKSGIRGRDAGGKRLRIISKSAPPSKKKRFGFAQHAAVAVRGSRFAGFPVSSGRAGTSTRRLFQPAGGDGGQRRQAGWGCKRTRRIRLWANTADWT